MEDKWLFNFRQFFSRSISKGDCLSRLICVELIIENLILFNIVPLVPWFCETFIPPLNQYDAAHSAEHRLQTWKLDTLPPFENIFSALRYSIVLRLFPYCCSIHSHQSALSPIFLQKNAMHPPLESHLDSEYCINYFHRLALPLMSFVAPGHSNVPARIIFAKYPDR